MPKQLWWLISAGVGVAALGGVLLFAQPAGHETMNQTPTGETLAVQLEPANYDFGTISMKDGLVTKSFQVTNPQDQDLDLATLYTSCMCTTVNTGPSACRGTAP